MLYLATDAYTTQVFEWIIVFIVLFVLIYIILYIFTGGNFFN